MKAIKLLSAFLIVMSVALPASAKTFYHTSGTNFARDGKELLGEIKYDLCFTQGFSNGKCSPRKLYIYSYKGESYTKANQSTCERGTVCDSIDRLVNAKKTILSSGENSIKNFGYVPLNE